jgi:IMP dehydrogenase
VLPTEVSTRTRITRSIELGVPLISAAMDTVTEARMAIAMAQAGGIGVIHKQLRSRGAGGPGAPGQEVRIGMVVNPLTIGPDATLADALTLMKENGISGIPVVDRAAKNVPASWSAS